MYTDRVNCFKPIFAADPKIEFVEIELILLTSFLLPHSLTLLDFTSIICKYECTEYE